MYLLNGIYSENIKSFFNKQLLVDSRKNLVHWKIKISKYKWHFSASMFPKWILGFFIIFSIKDYQLNNHFNQNNILIKARYLVIIWEFPFLQERNRIEQAIIIKHIFITKSNLMAFHSMKILECYDVMIGSERPKNGLTLFRKSTKLWRLSFCLPVCDKL